ncbi:MAG TPA: VCBS repeat-containing protein, partial [Cyclobacteriaceae bacterium]|nr:VCBS repeat-containing protein [Cyclobacteriaceae bacterium]
MRKLFCCRYYLLLTLVISCQQKPKTLFRLLPSDKTGVEFINAIEETDSFNILTEEYIYNGGGVGAGDFNNDGLQDLFFTGNLVSNKLYVNQGNLKFKDVTDESRLATSGIWSSGVAVVDINSDGWMDIYVCSTLWADSIKRRNLLYINQGLNENGVPTFEEQASSYGLGDSSYSVMAGFFDYDRDGDLDVYILVNQRLTGIPTNYRDKVQDGSSPNNDKLYRNNGNNTFTDVSREAGISIEGFGLGLSIADFNRDGWQDLYVSNDFLSNDILYINNQDGTFSNRSREFIGHQSQFSMGNDASDINNDGLSDIITLDMLPETNFRKKTTIGNKSYQTYINNEKYGYEYQHVRNMLQLNNNVGAGIGFSEIGQLSGIYQTEWSWSPLFADFDNDGNRDLVVTNGFPKDITDKDFANYRAMVSNLAAPGLLVDSIPVVKIPNYAYRNNGDLTFTDISTLWGFTQPSFSNGAVFSDLDNDGDLDYVVNNINDVAFVYENTLTDVKGSDSTHYLQLKLKGTKSNPDAIGAQVKIVADGQAQFYEQSIYRGYLSSVDPVVHFGLGTKTTVDSIFITWPDGKSAALNNVKVNQRLEVKYETSVQTLTNYVSTAKKLLPMMAEVSVDRKLIYRHPEEDKIDYNLQRTLPHKFTQYGPGMSVGDINDDGLEDLVIGGSVGHPTTVFVQDKNGSFSLKIESIENQNKQEEDMGLLLFDADGDKDLDLYVVSGGSEYKAFETQYQDRLYLNDGKGKYRLAADALPAMTTSGSCVRAADFDGDGDLDLFVGGRVVPAKYPYPAMSYLLRNEGGKFTDVTEEWCPGLSTLGMVTDAIWSDVDNSGSSDLIIVGEFMSIAIFSNTEKGLARISSELDNFKGWWNSIVGGDFDHDGDIDYVAGNYGLNNSYCATAEYPLKVYAKDFDNNGSVDAVLACYLKESLNQNIERKLFPVHFWDELNSQSPKFRQQFSSYKQYGRVTMQGLFKPDELKDAIQLEANFMSSAYIENLGGGKFEITSLPMLTQVAPINGMVTDDINDDGNLDLLIIGNDYGNEVFVGRMDALTGLVLLGNGRGDFSVMQTSESGFKVSGDAKGLVKIIDANHRELYVASQNRDSLKVFEKNNQKMKSQFFTPEALDVRAEIIFETGKKEKIEFYFGSGFLSQSSRRTRIPTGVKELIIYDSKGGSRKVTP